MPESDPNAVTTQEAYDEACRLLGERLVLDGVRHNRAIRSEMEAAEAGKAPEPKAE